METKSPMLHSSTLVKTERCTVWFDPPVLVFSMVVYLSLFFLVRYGSYRRLFVVASRVPVVDPVK
jgi:hypothetical protein